MKHTFPHVPFGVLSTFQAVPLLPATESLKSLSKDHTYVRLPKKKTRKNNDMQEIKEKR